MVTVECLVPWLWEGARHPEPLATNAQPPRSLWALRVQRQPASERPRKIVIESGETLTFECAHAYIRHMSKTAAARREEVPIKPRFLASSFARVRAVLVLKGLTFAALADSCDVTPYHLRLALSGERAMSEILAVCVRRELGDEGWFYVLGQRATPA